jgi:hypothetical protein
MAGRTFHTDSRTWSNFQPTELVKLCGVSQGRWPVYVIKELLDNATAVLEEHNKSNPLVRVTITDDFIEVAENGPGIQDWVLDNILDFDRFGGSNRHHKLPTRGAQGNAIMTLVGIASAWLPAGFIEIRRPCGPSLSLEVRLNKVLQEVDIERVVISEKHEMSSIRVPIPSLPWKMRGSDFDDIISTIKQFAWMNPHVTFMVNCRGQRWNLPSQSDARPCLSGNPQCGSSMWFTEDELIERFAADVRARPDTSIKDWSGEFAFRRTRDQRFAPALPMSAWSTRGNAFMRAKVGDLASKLSVDTDVKKSENPKFAAVGSERLGEFLASELGADPTAGVEYHSMTGTFGQGDTAVPYLVEVCLLQMPSRSRRAAPEPVLAMNRTVLYGSPEFKNIKYREKVKGKWVTLRKTALGGLCRAYQIDHGKTPCAIVVHVTCPSPGYSGYGKQQFDTSWLADPMAECFERVTLQVRKQRHGEARRKQGSKKKRDTIREDMFRLIPSVYQEATENEKYPILIRQFYYAFRKEWYVQDDRVLHYGTFCAYVDEYERNVAGKLLCLRDPRGTLYEPHSGRTLRLGTADVAAFKPKRWEGHTIIFVEKENLASLMKSMKIHKRWDAIIIGSKGFAVEAIRDVIQKYKKLLGNMVKIICLHDADPAGYMIGYDLATNLPRFGENVDIQVIDCGLSIKEALEMDLQDEPYDIKRQSWSMVNKSMRKLKIKNPDGTERPLMEPEAYDAFMPAMYRGTEFPTWADKPKGRRVELNAMPPRQFMEWVEKHLEANDCRKVRPPDEVVSEKLKSSRKNLVKNEVGNYLMNLLGEDAVLEVMAEVGVPSYDLDSVLEGRPEQHWEYLVERAGKTGVELTPIIDRVLKRKLGERP